MRRQNDHCARFCGETDRRQSGPNTRVVTDRAGDDRHVKVDPDQDTLPGEIEVVDRAFHRDRGDQPGPRDLKLLRPDLLDKIDTPRGVTPLVVVPGQHFDEVAVHDFRVGCVDDRRMRILAEVDRH